VLCRSGLLTKSNYAEIPNEGGKGGIQVVAGAYRRNVNDIRSAVVALNPHFIPLMRAARVCHEPRVTIIATGEDFGLTFGSDLTGKSAASPNSV